MPRMKTLSPLLSILAAIMFMSPPSAHGKEFLTEKEIELIQQSQQIDVRVRVYLEAAELRLKSAEERLTGVEPEAGNPLEFFTAEDLLDSYYRIVNSVMMNLDDAYRNRGRVGWERIRKALKTLKSSTEKNEPELEILKKRAEEKKKEELWNLLNKAIEITQGAREGAEDGLSQKLPSPRR